MTNKEPNVVMVAGYPYIDDADLPWDDRTKRLRLKRPKIDGLTTGQAMAVEARFHLGLTGREFGELLGLNHTTVERWEKGQSSVGEWYIALLTLFLRAPQPLSNQLVADLRRLGPVPVVFELMRRGMEAAEAPKKKAGQLAGGRPAGLVSRRRGKPIRSYKGKIVGYRNKAS